MKPIKLNIKKIERELTRLGVVGKSKQAKYLGLNRQTMYNVWRDKRCSFIILDRIAGRIDMEQKDLLE